MYDLKLNASTLPWVPLLLDGVSMKVLNEEAKTGGQTVLTKMDSGALIPAHHHLYADETVYVLEGDFIEDETSYGPGSFFAAAVGTRPGPHSTKNGCVLLTTFSATFDFVAVEWSPAPVP